MAAKQTVDTIMSDLKARRFKPIYILMGEEPYYIDKISDYIENNVMPPEERDFNQTVVYGVDTSAAQVVDMARRFPMMSEYQVIIVKEAQNIKNWDRLDSYLEKPLNTTILVICYKHGTMDARKKYMTKAAAVGVVFKSEKLRENAIPAFIDDYVKQQKATIEPKAKAMIADFIGADLSRITSEIDKVLVSLPEGERKVTPETVEQKIGISKDYNMFELRDALINKDVLKANRIVKYLDSNPKSASLYAFLPGLFSFFQNLMVAHYTDRTDRGVMLALGFKSEWAVKDYMKALRVFSAGKTMKIIQQIRETDAKSKGIDNPNTSPGDLLKQLVFFILH
jgi:DNA polymerase-3 subunit delta